MKAENQEISRCATSKELHSFVMETVAHLMTLTVHLRVPLGQTTYRRNYHPNIYVRHIPNNVAVLTVNP